MGSNRWMRNGFVYLLVIIGIIVIFYTLLPSFGGKTDRADNHGHLPSSRTTKSGRSWSTAKSSPSTPRPFHGAAPTGSRAGLTGIQTLLACWSKAALQVGPPSGVEVSFKGSSGLSSFFGLLLNFLPLIFFGGLILFMMRQAQGSNNQTLSFGRSRARMMTFQPSRRHIR